MNRYIMNQAAEDSKKDDPREVARDMAILELLYGGGRYMI